MVADVNTMRILPVECDVQSYLLFSRKSFLMTIFVIWNALPDPVVEASCASVLSVYWIILVQLESKYLSFLFIHYNFATLLG